MEKLFKVRSLLPSLLYAEGNNFPTVGLVVRSCESRDSGDQNPGGLVEFGKSRHSRSGQSLLSTKIKVLSPLPNMIVEKVANLMLSPHLVRAEPNFNVPDVSHTTLYL